MLKPHPTKNRLDRLLERLEGALARPATFLICGAVLVIAALAIAIGRLPVRWWLLVSTTATVLTFLIYLVFIRRGIQIRAARARIDGMDRRLVEVEARASLRRRLERSLLDDEEGDAFGDSAAWRRTDRLH